MIDKTLSGTLMAANLIATILVIAIHYNSKAAIDISQGYGLSYVVQDFIINGIARVAVPLFAMVSGFFIWGKLNRINGYVLLLKTRLKTQVVPYLIASLFIFVSSFLLVYLFKPNELEDLNFISIFHGIVLHPKSPQLWFLRDLMLLVMFSPLLASKFTMLNGLVSLVFGFLWFLNVQIFPVVGGYYLINIETVFFFCLGAFLANNHKMLKDVININLLAKSSLISLWLMLILVRVYLDPELDVWYTTRYTLTSLILYKLAILLGVFMMLSLCKPLASNKGVIYFSGLTFFAFLYHLVPLSYFRILTEQIVIKEFSFFINFPIATFVVFFLAHATAKHLPKAYGILTGGRSPQKAIERSKGLTQSSQRYLG